jgi:hypothetical protein
LYHVRTTLEDIDREVTRLANPKGMPVDLAEQAAWLRGQREAHDDVRDIVAREDSLEGLRSALEDLVDGEVGEGQPPVVWKQGPTTLWRDGVWESRGWWAEGEDWHASTRPRTDPSGDLWEWCVWCRGEQTSGFTTKSEEEARRRAEEALVVMLPVTRAGAVVDKEPVEHPGPTIRTVEAVVTSVSERVIPPVSREFIGQRLDDDCMRCCLAMTTGFSYEDVPHFVAQYPPDIWPVEMVRWLDVHGWTVVVVHATGDGELLPSIYRAPMGTWIASGLSSRGRIHAVLYQGVEMLYDPHPSQAGLETITGATVLWLKPKPRGDQ